MVGRAFVLVLLLACGCRAGNPAFRVKKDGGVDHVDAGSPDTTLRDTAIQPIDTPPPPAADSKVLSVNGLPCANVGQCKSGFCVDGVCCNEACVGTCRTCIAASGFGICKMTPAGFDPRNDCAAQPSATCGREGNCNGAGACRLHPAGVPCAGPTCANGIETSTSFCDGIGKCLVATRMCAPYVCAGAACAASCAAPGECLPGYACVGGQCASLGTGLVARWRLDEGQGTVLNDSSGNGVNGMFGAVPMWTQMTYPTAKEPNPYALYFEGTNDFLIVPNPPSDVLSFGAGSFSLSLWVYVTGVVSQFDTPLYKGGSSAGDPGYLVELGDLDWNMGIADGQGYDRVYFAYTPVLNQWVHLVGVRDAQTGEVRAYLNGALTDAHAAQIGSISTGRDLYLGASYGPGNFFMGIMDDVRIYNRALSKEEVTALQSGQ